MCVLRTHCWEWKSTAGDQQSTVRGALANTRDKEASSRFFRLYWVLPEVHPQLCIHSSTFDRPHKEVRSQQDQLDGTVRGGLQTAQSCSLQLPCALFILRTDASDRGVGAVLSQMGEDNLEHPVAYFSKKLLSREEKYSIVEKECLAVKLGVQAF